MFRQLKLLALAASLVGAVALSGCGGGGFGGSGGSGGAEGSPILDANPPPEKVAVLVGDDISAEEGRKVAETVSRLNLGLGGGSVSPEDVRVSHDRAVLDRDPFSASSGVPAARKLGVATTRALRGRGYKAFEFPVPAESPIMTVAVWISETPPPDQKSPDPKTPEGKTDAPAKTIYVRLQVFVSPAKLGLAGSDAMVQDLETQEVAVQVKTPKPKPTCAAGEVLDSRWNVCVSLRPADNICPGGSLPAGGRTQAELNAGLRAASRGGDAEKICEWLRRGAEVGDTRGGAEWSVLHEAVSEEHPAAAALLLANDADVNFRKEGEGWSPLDIAVRKENAEIAALLREAGGLCFLETGPLCSDPSAAALVTVSFSWSGLGTIWAESGGVRLSSGDLVPQDARVTFRAVGAAGHYAQLFAVYGGDCVKAAGGGLDCVAGSGVANLSSSARFVPHRSAEIPKVAVNFSASGLGFGTISAQSGGDFLSSGDEVPQGATVVFTAIPLAGHYVSGWGGACADSDFADGLDGSAKECRLAADAALSVEARFSAVPSLSGPLCPAGSLPANGMTQAALDAGLISAAKANDLAAACEWLRRGANVEARESSREFLRTGLMIAAGGGFLELAKLLHANGADVNLAGGSHGRSPRAISDITPGWTALHYAATAGHADMVSWLLDAGAAIDALWTRGGKTALWEAAAYGRIDAVAVLLSRGADVVRKEGYRGTTPLHAATWLKLANFEDNFVMASYPPVPQGEGSDVALVSLILSYSAEVNARSDNGWSALDYAANQGRARIAEVLRNAGGRCFVQSGPLCGVPAVVTAETVCAAGSLPANGMSQAALDAGLLSAAEANDLSGACEYLRRGADADARESGRYYGRTALMMAANDGFLGLAKLLHANGADVNLAGGNHDGYFRRRGWSALHYAAAAGHAEMARWLLNSGAVLEAAWESGKTALWEAAYWGRPAVVGLLLSRGANKETNFDGGSTPLHAAVEEGEGWVSARKWVASPFRYKRMAISYSYPHPTAADHAVVMSLLLSAGSEVNVRRRGLSPLDSAARSGNALFAGILREHGGVCFVETGPLCGVAAAVTAETVCAAGTLPAGGRTQAALDAGLLSAARGNDLAGACEYLRRGANIRAQESGDYYHRSALAIAANHNRMELARLLVANGADVSQRGGRHVRGYGDGRWSPLHFAAAAGHLEMIRFLLDAGANIEAPWDSGATPLWEASYWGRGDIVALLLSRGARVDGGGHHESALHMAVAGGLGSPVWGYSWATYDYASPTAAGYGAAVSLLLSHGADANARAHGSWGDGPPGIAARAGDGPLDSAARAGHSEYSALLRSYGGRCFVETGPLCGVPAVVTAETVCAAGTLPANGMTQAALDQGLIAAALENDLEGVCENLRRGADVDAQGNMRQYRRTALMIAAGGGFSELAKLLHANGANVNVQGGNHLFNWENTPGWAALHYAAAAGHSELVSWLLDSGADKDAQWGAVPGKSVIWEAAVAGRVEVVRVLLSRGADVNARSSAGWLPLHAAVHPYGGLPAVHPRSDFVLFHYRRPTLDSHAAVVSLLVSHVADVNAAPNGRTALDLAADDGGKARIAEILRNAGGVCRLRRGRPLCGVPAAVTAETVCAAGTLSANGMTQAALDQGLIAAALENDLEGACENLRRGANVNAEKRVARGVMETALIVAASYGRMELAQLLIRNGAAVNLGGEHSRWQKDRITPLMAASGLGRLAMAEFLISQGAEIDAVDTRGRGALYEAAHSGRWAIVEMLLARGANANLQEGWGETPLYGALVGWDGYGREGYAAETLNWVRERGATRNPDGIASWVKVINALLAGGADANLQRTANNWAGPGRAAALDYAARLGHSEFARILREADGKCFVEAGPLCGDEMVAVELSSSGWGLFYAQSSGRGGSMFFEQGEVMRGATVIFTAAPSAGHYVSAWGGECAGAAGAAVLLHATLGGASDAASKTCALVATQALNVNAVFAAVPVAGPGPATILVTVANTVVVETLSCPAGSLPANGLTQAALNLTLRAAARGGDSAGVCEALRRGAEVNDDQGGTEFTPLQEAVHGGHLRAAEILLANGAEVNARKEGLGPSPLDLAAKGEKEKIARVLRAAGGRCFLETGPLCGVPVAGPGPVTILATVGGTVAVETGSCPAGSLPADGLTQAELNQGLLDEVRDAGDNGNWDGRKRTEICEWLRRGADINSYVPYDATTDSSSGMPLLYAAWSTPLGDSRDNSHFSEIVEFLIANGADVNKRSGGREWPVPLFAAPKSRGMVFGEGEEHVEIEEITGILLRNGADVHVTNEYGRTALLNVIYRFQSWNSGVVKMLLDAGSDPDAKDNEEDAALHRLARGGDFPDMAELLLRRGADVNVRDSYDDTPLHYVVRKRERDYSSYGSEVRMSLMVVLLEHGADVSAINSFGETPLRIARGRKWSRYSDADERQWYSAVVDLMEAALPSPTVVLESRSVPVSEDDLAEALRGRFANAFNAGPAFGDSFGAVADSSGGLLSRLDGVMRGGVSAKEDWAAFSGWQKENTTGRLWFSTRHRGDFGFGAGGGGMGGAVDGSPFAALSGNGLLAGGEMALGSERLRFAAFGDLQSRSLLSGEERRWTDWAASGTAIETAMAEAERLSGAADNRTRGALTEIHLGGDDSGLAFQAGALSESESLLSGTSRGEDLRGLRSRTAFAGVSGSADLFGGGWRVRGAAHVGRSWAESSGVLRSGDLWASSFSAGLERGGWLYSGDGVMFRISQPLRVESWEMDLMEGGEVRRLLVSPSGRQLDLDAAYRLPLSGGGWLLLSAGVRRGSGHVGSSGLEGGALFSLERDF